MSSIILKVEPSKEIKDGLHDGIIKRLETRQEPYSYLDLIIEVDGKLELKVGYPLSLNPQSGLGRLLVRFGAVLNVGEEVSVERWLFGKPAEFLTINERNERGTFARIIPESVKPR